MHHLKTIKIFLKNLSILIFQHGGVHEHNYQEIDPMSHNYAENGDSQSSSADPSGGLSKVGFYCLISCRAKIDFFYITS